MTAPESKTCSKCGENKPLSDFPKNGRGGRRADCKACHSANVKARYHANVELARERNREWKARDYAADPGKWRARAKTFRDADPARHTEWSIAWAAANPEKVRAYKRKYDQANPDKTRDAVRRRRARMAGNESQPYSERAIYERDGGRCCHCRCALPLEPRAGWHIDHIVPIVLGGPDTPTNVQLMCPLCNRSKYTRLEGQIHFAV